MHPCTLFYVLAAQETLCNPIQYSYYELFCYNVYITSQWTCCLFIHIPINIKYYNHINNCIVNWHKHCFLFSPCVLVINMNIED